MTYSSEYVASGPLVSVVLAAYNSEKYLREVLESLRNQTYKNLEYVFVDDGSADGTLGIFEEFSKNNDRVTVLSKENGGVGSAVNFALPYVSGKYIARSDADDISLPTRIATQVAYLEDNSHVVALGTGILMIDPMGIPLVENVVVADHDEIVGKLLRGDGSVVCQPSVMLKTDAFRQVQGYDERWKYTEDLDLFIRLSEVGELRNLSDVLVCWRQHLSSTNHTKRERQIRESKALLCEAYANRGLSFDGSFLDEVRIIDSVEFLSRWGWNALSNGKRFLAFKYALEIFRISPFEREGVKLMLCSLRGW